MDLASGSAGDLAIEDNLELFEFTKQRYLELLNGTSLESIYSSKIFELAQIILMAFDNPEKGFRVLKESIDRPLELYNTELYERYLKKQESIRNFFEKYKNRVFGASEIRFDRYLWLRIFRKLFRLPELKI